MIKKLNLKEDKFRLIFSPLFVLFLLGLLASFISFSKGNYYILGGDLYYPLDPNIDLFRTPFAWDVRYAAGGTSEARHIPSLIYFLYFFLLDKLSISLIAAQQIAIFSIFTLTAPAMYYLVMVIFQDQKKEIQSRERLIAFIAALFYNYNLWNLFNWAAPSVHLQLSYLAAPLVLAFFIKGIREFNFLYVVYLALLYILIALIASNPIYTLNTIWPVVFFLTFILIKQALKRNWKGITRSLLFSSSVLAIFILINSWWILLMLDTLKNSVKIIEGSGNVGGWLNWKSTMSSFLNIFRLTNHQAWIHTNPGHLILASARGYVKNFFLIFTSFLFPVLAFSNLLKKKKNFYVLYFSIMAVTMIFLAKGGHEPLGAINRFLHRKFLILTIYRSIEWYTPMIVLSYSFLLGEGVFLVYDFLKPHGKILGKYFLISIIGIIFVSNYPFWTGKVVHQGQWTGEIANPYFVKIPDSYFEAAEWVNNQQDDFRILSMPSDNPYYHTDWGFSGGELGIFLFNKPIVNNIFGWEGAKKLSATIIDYLNSKTYNGTIDVARFLNLMNIKYIALRHDEAYWTGEKMIKIEANTRRIAEKLKFQNNISLKKTIGKIDFLENDNFLPHIYAAPEVIIIEGDLNSLVPLTLTSYLDDYPALAFTEQQSKETLRTLIDLKWKNGEAKIQNDVLLVNSRADDLNKEFKNALSQLDVNYLFHVDNQKVNEQIRDREKLEEIKSSGINPFRLGKQKFYIYRDAEYSIRAMLKPKRTFIKKDIVSSISTGVSKNAMSGWNVRPLNPDFEHDPSDPVLKHTISKDGMHIPEGVVLTKKFDGINIRNTPYLAFFCEIDDPDTHEIEMDIKVIDTDSENLLSKKTTLIIEQKIHTNRTIDQAIYTINLYKKFKDEFGKRASDNIMVEEVVLKLKRKYGKGLTENEKKYEFLFKNLGFYERDPVFLDFSDSLLAYVPGYYYYFNEHGGLRNVNFIDRIPTDIRDVYRLNTQEFVDLEKIPLLPFEIAVPKNDHIDKQENFPAEWRMVLGLDFDGDSVEDEKIELFVPASGRASGNARLMFKIRAYDEVKKRYSDKKVYNLISIGVSHPNDNKIFFQNVITKKLIRSRENLYKPSDFKSGDRVLKVADKIFTLPASITKNKNKNNNVKFLTTNMFLKEGEYSFNDIENDKFTVEMVEIKTGDRGPRTEAVKKNPETTFRNINPTRYVVDVKRAEEPFTLVFSESYHDGWKAYIRRSGIKGQGSEAGNEHWSALWSAWKDRENRIEIKEHFVVNGYANGWIVPVKQWSGEGFQIVLEYKPQRLFETGTLISAAALLGCMGYLGCWFTRKRKKSNEN